MTPSSVSAVEWDATLYAAHSGHHRSFDAEFLEALEVLPGSSILDIGCGTGELTATLAAMVGDGRVVGLDVSESMVAEATRRHPGISFVHGSAQQLGPELGSFDLVVSTAAFHWIPARDHPLVLRNIRGVLAPRGRFRAEFGGRGQIRSARRILAEEARRMGLKVRPVWYFPTPAAYMRRLVAAGFSEAESWVRLRHQRRPLPDREALIGWLRSQVTIAYSSSMTAADSPEFQRRVEARAVVELRRADGSFDQDYVRTDLSAVAGGAT
ncbi:MAG TPA: methyltransferase domain-containing protein [Candidatus Dormibacteraeota bacterium]|nr:methyltransferase domain-containing protein [Candidatus Dormibacteraeota bacterium]